MKYFIIKIIFMLTYTLSSGQTFQFNNEDYDILNATFDSIASYDTEAFLDKKDTSKRIILINDSTVNIMIIDMLKEMVSSLDLFKNNVSQDTSYIDIVREMIYNPKCTRFDTKEISTKLNCSLENKENNAKFNYGWIVSTINFSVPHYNKAKTKACIYAETIKGPLNAEGILFFLKKENNKWIIIDMTQLWIS